MIHDDQAAGSPVPPLGRSRRREAAVERLTKAGFTCASGKSNMEEQKGHR
jgi:hypothetical protein